MNDHRPDNCRMRLEAEGKDHPKSRCAVFGCAGVWGPFCEADTLRQQLKLAISEVHSGDGQEGEKIINAVALALVNAGYKLIPVNPTDEMLIMGAEVNDSIAFVFEQVIATAPDILIEEKDSEN